MKSFLFALMLFGNASWAVSHPVPKSRTDLKGSDWFPFVFSKIAPLEEWRVETSATDIKRENYTSDSEYGQSIRNTWEFPRFCFSFFRPPAEAGANLRAAIEQYHGAVTWVLMGGCVSAYPAGTKFTFYTPLGSDPDAMAKFTEAMRNPPKPDPELVRLAISDVPTFCSYLEESLGLTGKTPQDFDLNWLTTEGLRQSRPEPEDFVEPGDWWVELRPQQSTQQGSARVSFSFGPTDLEISAILDELGGNRDKRPEERNRSLLLRFPMLSRLGGFSALDTFYFTREEARWLYSECVQVQPRLRSRKAIRGMDKLIRMAHRADELQMGIFFAGED